jgi:hypothetical protein
MPDLDPFSLDRFPSTRGSLVARTCDPDAGTRREALDELLRVYLPALRACLCDGWGLSADKAEDILQSFVASQILQRQLIGRFDAARGRFRALLRKSLQNFASRQLARERSISSHESFAADPLMDDASIADASAARAYDVEWARQVLRGALQRMQFVCRAEDNLARWDLFALRIVRPLLGGAAEPSLKDLAQRFGYESAEKVSNALVTAKRQFARILRRLIAETEEASSESEIDEVIAELATILREANELDGYWENLYGAT